MLWSRSLEIAKPIAALGQTLLIWPVRTMSGLSPVATRRRTSGIGSLVPSTETRSKHNESAQPQRSLADMHADRSNIKLLANTRHCPSWSSVCESYFAAVGIDRQRLGNEFVRRGRYAELLPHAHQGAGEVVDLERFASAPVNQHGRHH
jgi:hypothetical protein